METPHTITTWIADAVCSDLKSGLSVSNKAELLVTQVRLGQDRLGCIRLAYVKFKDQ